MMPTTYSNRTETGTNAKAVAEVACTLRPRRRDQKVSSPGQRQN